MPNSTALYNWSGKKNIAYQNQHVIQCDEKSCFFLSPSKNKDSEFVKPILHLPYSLFIEAIPQNKKRDRNDRQKPIEKELNQANLLENTSKIPPDMALSITTESCYSNDLAHSFTDALGERFNLNANIKTQMIICLHEAIMNAMLHGNLEVGSNFRNLQDLYKYQDEIGHRIKLKTYKFRRIHIRAWHTGNSLEIAVSDEGNGFEIPTGIADETLPHGRGLRLIQSMADEMWVQDLNVLFMRFTHQEPKDT